MFSQIAPPPPHYKKLDSTNINNYLHTYNLVVNLKGLISFIHTNYIIMRTKFNYNK